MQIKHKYAFIFLFIVCPSSCTVSEDLTNSSYSTFLSESDRRQDSGCAMNIIRQSEKTCLKIQNLRKMFMIIWIMHATSTYFFTLHMSSDITLGLKN